MLGWSVGILTPHDAELKAKHNIKVDVSFFLVVEGVLTSFSSNITVGEPSLRSKSPAFSGK